MTAEISTTRHNTSTARLDHEGGLLGANRLADAAKRRWQQGEQPNADRVLVSHPELQQYRSVVLNLAYAEYRTRLNAGESIDAEAFARRFPSLEKSLYLLIEVHGLLSHDPELQHFQESVCWPEAGNRFLQFDLTAEIGRGAFGRVFLATEPAIGGRQVVVKVAPHGGGEADIIGRLRHPNIVPIYSLQEDETSKLTAFCMPYLGRATLCDVLDQSFTAGRPPVHARAILDAVTAVNCNLDSQESPSPALVLRRGSYVNGVIHLVAQLADGLAHSHGRGIYHRDLKPSNVLVTPEGRPLLLDFNLSIDSHLAAWKVGGTLPYMAPEELANLASQEMKSHPISYDPRSDIFSLGVIVYELLTGKLPFGAIPENCPVSEAARQLRRQQANGPKPIRGLNSLADRGLARLVESCLAFEPDCRPATAEHLAAAFHRELSFSRRGSRWIGTHRGLVLGLSVALLSVLLATVLFFAMRPPYSDRQLQLGLHRLDEAQYAKAIDYLSNSLRTNPTSSEALFARGRAYQGFGKFQMAFQDYDSAYQLNRSPIISACRGYCLGLVKSHKAAIASNDLALKQGYDRPALLYNNMGYCHLMLGQLKEAEECFLQAVRLDDNLQAAHYNMVVLFLRQAIHGAPPKTAFFHAARAIEIGPPTADLCRSVADLYAAAAIHDPALVLPAIGYVAKAIESGTPPSTFLSDALYSKFRNEPAFHDALRKTTSSVSQTKAMQLVDPLNAP